MKQAWVRIAPWNKDLAVAALESGADAVVLEAGAKARMAELGVMKVLAPDGDLRPGVDVIEMEIKSKADEVAAAKAPGDKILVLRMQDWTIIPLENLIAQRGKLFVVVRGADEARTAIQVLEKGVDGVVIETDSAAEVRRAVTMAHDAGAKVSLEPATVKEARPLGMGDRVCVDTCSNMDPGEGMLVGNATEGLFLVHAETMDNPYVAARPFRVNAGAVHAYTLTPGERTRYLSELKAGDEALVVRHDGKTRVAFVGRSKVERRPLMLVRAEARGVEIGVVLQNAETIRLTAPGGKSISVAALKPGDQVLVHLMGGARHFGMKVEETLKEK
ncbi:MAG TPA: 3-dehydroquinate synthase II [Candidatus Brocadiia bacterium]|nr:3-dehydroquinate synthase II [Candidatus Brocadiia bacterium]